MFPQRLFLIAAVLALAACKSEAIDLGLSCESDAQTTLVQGSAIAYGADIPPPQVVGVRPINEDDLFGIEMGDPVALGLMASDATGAFHHTICDGALCSVEDAKTALSKCTDEPGCKVVGAVRDKTFFPLYLSDETGGHICDPRWR